MKEMSESRHPICRRVTKSEFLVLCADAMREKAFPPSGPEYYFKDGRHFGFENLTTGECIIFDWDSTQLI